MRFAPRGQDSRSRFPLDVCVATVAVGLAIGTSLRAADRALGSETSPPEPKWTAEQRSHWSFAPLSRPKPPAVKTLAWVRNPVDAFILEQLESVNMKPAREADRATLIRRATFDLTGLPPTPAEVEAFVADAKPQAYERLVDRLLESKAYGERWARMWLDLARFAESDGFKSDKTRPNAWRYRDWVIQAFNDDMPYDEFVRLQLAGDEYAPGDPAAFVATGFNRNWPFEDNNKVPGLSRQLMLEDMTDTTASVFLGLTVGCARCHNHKYDPISQKDYYRFQALFAASAPKDDYPIGSPAEQAFHATALAEHKARVTRVKREIERVEKPYLVDLLKDKLAKLPADVRKALETDPEKRSAFQEDLLVKHAKSMTVESKTIRSAMKPEDRRTWTDRTNLMKSLTAVDPGELASATGMTDEGTNAPDVRLLAKGNFAKPLDVVPPGFLSVLASIPSPKLDQARTASTSGRRKALAEWLTRPDHPLTARVIVNRVWQNHFGRGIVATPSDFGTQGADPTHPELLDWLATEFVAGGWKFKALHKLLVTSATYRQSSVGDPATVAEDPDNTMFGRTFRRRLEGEAVRDALLAVAGKLDLRSGGPSVFPDLPPGVETRGGWTRSESESDRNRRSIYIFVRRNLKYPLFDAFDLPDSNTTCPERNVSVNAPQALMLLNSDTVLDTSRALAGRLLNESRDRNDLGGLVDRAYRLGFGRSPSSDERARGVSFIERQTETISGSSKLALPTPLPEGYLPARGAALVDYCHVLLNLNEFVFVD